MTGDCGFGSDGAFSRIVAPSSSLEQRSVSLTKAQRVGSSHVVNDLPTELDKLLGLESVPLLEAENRQNKSFKIRMAGRVIPQALEEEQRALAERS